MLTKKIVQSAVSEGSVRKLADEKGLYLYISKVGGKSWRYDFRFAGKRFTLTFGKYPELGLDDARRKHLEARTKIANGVNPAEEKLAQKRLVRRESGASAFARVADVWFRSKVDRRSTAWEQANKLYLSRDLNPSIGDCALENITADLLLDVLEQVEKRSGVKTADRVRQTCVQVLDYGMRKRIVSANVARSLVGWAEIPGKKHRAWLKENELPKFFSALNDYDCLPSTKYAIRLLLHTFVRKSELIAARWEEFDIENALWIVPAERMKMSAEKKQDRHNAHDVPLSKQVLALLEELRPMSFGSEYLFPGMSSLEKHISKSTLNVAFNRMGFASLFTPHGIRSTASTILNERSFRGDWVEKQLAHVDSNQVRAAYNHAKYLAERRDMMQVWSDILESIEYQGKASGADNGN